MCAEQKAGPDSTAVRVALWRALHVQVDPPPHVLEDEIGLRLVNPDDGWRKRGDMNPRRTRRARASIVGRARIVEDLVTGQAEQAASQYVILGAGLDTFAQRRPEVASRMRVFEIDRPGPQSWKRQRLVELGFGVPEWLRLVPVDFEAGRSRWERLTAAGFDPGQPSVVASTGVTMYLTRDAITATLRQIAEHVPCATLAMTFMLPLDLVEPEDRAARPAQHRRRGGGTSFLSVFSPQEMLELAREAGFEDAQRVSAADLTARYFADRTDGLRPSSSEELLVAATLPDARRSP
jgi:methyltransferase (TIGR00027 family)